MRTRGVGRKLFRVFALQLVAISAAVVLGVWASGWVLSDVLIKQALEQEAALYASRLALHDDAPAPDTVNLKGYFQRAPGDPVPGFMVDLPDGFHDLETVEQGSIGYIETLDNGKMFLVFKEENVMNLALYFGLVPMSLVLLTIYLAAWLTYRLSSRAISPMVRLARRVENIDLENLDEDIFNPDEIADADQEVFVLAQALQQLKSRLQHFIARERDFTRDASHELRTPVTVIQMASEMLLEEGQLGDYETKTVHRIRTVAKDMQALIEALLLLARESDQSLPTRDFVVNELLDDEVRRSEYLVRNKQVNLRLIEDRKLRIHTAPNALAVVVGNLIRNACLYTNEGEVRVVIGHGFVSVDDTGVGMTESDIENAFKPFNRAGRSGKGGHGVGLTIVKRMSDRFEWPLEMHSRLGVGTQATVYFPDFELIDDQATDSGDFSTETPDSADDSRTVNEA